MDYFAVAVVGLALGSFANVLIIRIPDSRDWKRARSACPQCGHLVRWYDNVPVAGWLVLRGKCRDCRGSISPQYPLVELTVAAGAVALYSFWGLRWFLGSLIILWFATVIWSVVDVRHKRLPDAVTAIAGSALALGMMAESVQGSGYGALMRALAGCVILGGAYGVLWLIYPRGLGFGDVKVAGVLGAACGFVGWSALAVGGIAGPLIGGAIVTVGLVAGKLKRDSSVPYGPALIAGAWLGIMAGAGIAAWYTQLVLNVA